MNVKQVKESWTMQRLMAHLGYSLDEKKSRGHKLWYSSPFRAENDSSFKVETDKDTWYDFGLAENKNGGDLIYFAQSYLKHQGKPNSVSEALEWFSSLSGSPAPKIQKNAPVSLKSSEKAVFNLISAKPIFSKALFDYIDTRKIDRRIATEFLEQVYFEHIKTGSKMYGVGLRNVAGGYDVRNPLDFKGCIGQKAISHIKGKSSESIVEVFEGTFDFLSRLTLQKRAGRLVPEFDSIIMHTNNLFQSTADKIREENYSEVRFWLDNDQGGDKGIAAIQNCLADLSHISYSDERSQYVGCKDLNAYILDQ